MNFYRINMNFSNKKLVHNVNKAYVEVVKIIKKTTFKLYSSEKFAKHKPVLLCCSKEAIVFLSTSQNKIIVENTALNMMRKIDSHLKPKKNLRYIY